MCNLGLNFPFLLHQPAGSQHPSMSSSLVRSHQVIQISTTLLGYKPKANMTDETEDQTAADPVVHTHPKDHQAGYDSAMHLRLDTG